MLLFPQADVKKEETEKLEKIFGPCQWSMKEKIIGSLLKHFKQSQEWFVELAIQGRNNNLQMASSIQVESGMMSTGSPVESKCYQYEKSVSVKNVPTSY